MKWLVELYRLITGSVIKLFQRFAIMFKSSIYCLLMFLINNLYTKVLIVWLNLFTILVLHYFFINLFGNPMTNLGPLLKGHPHSFDVNHCVLLNLNLTFTDSLVMSLGPLAWSNT